MNISTYIRSKVLALLIVVGAKYPPNTIYNIVTGIQRYLREECGRPEVNFMAPQSLNFSEFRSTLDAVMKTLSAQGHGVVSHAENLSVDDEEKLWNSGAINKTTSKGLSYGVFFYNMKVFGFRGLSEHKQVNAEQYAVRYNHLGHPVLVFQEHVSKTQQGGLNQRKQEPKVVTQYPNPSNPRCVVDLFVQYLKLIPPKGPFYRRPLPSPKDGVPRFSLQVVGINTLSKYLQSMFDDAGIDRKVKNHSGRVYSCSTLYNAGFEEQEVMMRSGHRNSAVRTYKRPSETKLKEISDALQPPPPKTVSVENCVPLSVKKSVPPSNEKSVPPPPSNEKSVHPSNAKPVKCSENALEN